MKHKQNTLNASPQKAQTKTQLTGELDKTQTWKTAVTHINYK